MLFAVKIAAVAIPCAFVVAVFTPPANVPLAPLAGAAKVTVAPLTGLFVESFTVACSCTENAVLTDALCGVPAVAVIVNAGAEPVAGLNAAKAAPQLSDAPSDALADTLPAVAWIWSSAISFVPVVGTNSSAT